MRIAIFCALTAASLLLSGCIFDPDEGSGDTPPPPPAYSANTTPGYVLLNLITAYQARDSVEYKVLYDSSYVGTSTDQPSSQVLTLTYANEVDHVAGLRRSTEVVNVFLDLGPQSSWNIQPSDDADHPEYQVIQLNYYRISVATLVDEYVVTPGPGEFIKFTFKPTPSAESPTGYLWSIIGWQEIGSVKPTS